MESFQVSTGREENGCIREGKCPQERKSKSYREEAQDWEMGKVYQIGKTHAEKGEHTIEKEGKHTCKGVET